MNETIRKEMERVYMQRMNELDETNPHLSCERAAGMTGVLMLVVGFVVGLVVGVML